MYPNGSVYEGEFADGVQHGRGKMVYFDGNIYEGEFNQGLGALSWCEGKRRG